MKEVNYYPINQLVFDYMRLRGVDRNHLVWALGYPNGRSAYRAYDSISKKNSIEPEDELRGRIYNVLQIPDAEVEAAWQKTRERLELERLEQERLRKEAAEKEALILDDRKLMREFYLFILENSERILETPEYYFCEPEGCYLSLAYISGGAIRLGVMIEIWQKNLVPHDCSKCGGKVLFLGAGGSPLSGNHSAWGYCSVCGSAEMWRNKTFSSIWQPVREVLYTRETGFRYRSGIKGRHFDWKDGVVGEDTPGEVIDPGVQQRTLLQVIWELGDETVKKSLENRFTEMPDLRYKSVDKTKFGYLKIGNKIISGSLLFD